MALGLEQVKTGVILPGGVGFGRFILLTGALTAHFLFFVIISIAMGSHFE